MSSNVESSEDFKYILEEKKEDRICFGTTVARSTSPIGKGLSCQQRMRVCELFSKTSPSYYRTELTTSALYPLANKKRSKAGTVPLCSKVPRFKEIVGFQIPSPGRYNTCKFVTKFKQNAAPFGIRNKIREKKFNSHPGSGTYNINSTLCRKINVCHLGVPRVINAVEMFCTNKAVDVCQKCEKLCEGDYWHREKLIFLCHVCHDEEVVSNEMYSKSALKEFKKIRNCSFMHDHQKTKAALRILPLKKVKKKVQIENYLSLFM